MNRCSFCEWIPILPWPVWPLAGHARLGQNTVVGSMTILLSWLCWGACQEEVCLDPRFLCNLTLPRFSVELPALTAPWVKATSARPRDHAPAALKPYQEGIIAGICGAAAITLWFLILDV